MENNQITYPIHRSWILGILLITPLVLCLGLWDQWFNDQALLPHLGLTSLFLPLYVLIFEMPHIIASFSGFADREYVQHYGKHLWLGMPALLVAFALLLWVNFEIAVAVYLAATMYHVMRQQTGIALLFGSPKNNWHHWWSWSLVLSTAVIYIALMLPDAIAGFSLEYLSLFILLTFFISIVCGLKLATETPSRSGVWYIVLTLAMVATSYYMVWLGYIFLAVFVARFVHDVTAFLFYITHEMNRNQGKVKNFFYKFVPFLPYSLVLIVPFVAILLGLFLRESIADTNILFIIIMLLAFMHYYLESVMWKRDSPHRHQVRVYQ